tara:strand:- start:287 stop:1726 length:1440 start_codon:yes stop_codon:yes gene_type:complete
MHKENSDSYNVIFIMADQMKATSSNLYSKMGVDTPNLKRIAREGVLFNNAVTPHPLCVPARTSIMTSRYPHTNGCRRNETLMPDNELHVFDIWKQNGFKTGLIGKNHCFETKKDISNFDTFIEYDHLGTNDNRREMPWITPQISYKVTDDPIETYGSFLIADKTLNFLEKNQDNPFALWVSFPDPHEPYEVPKKYFNEVKGTFEFPKLRSDEFSDGTAPERNVLLNKILSMSNASIEEKQNLITVYMAMVKFVDDSIGTILDKLEELNLKRKTIIVFTADHGDFAGEHDMIVKGGVFYDCLIRVPLIISSKNIISKNKKIEHPVNTIDIMPTVLELQGLIIPKSFQGNLLPISDDIEPQKASFSEYGTGGRLYQLNDLKKLNKPYGYKTLIECLWAREAEGRRKMVRTKDWKYVFDSMGDKDELYDLKNDPWEHYNLASKKEYLKKKNELKSLLLDWMIKTEDPNPVPLPESVGPVWTD